MVLEIQRQNIYFKFVYIVHLFFNNYKLEINKKLLKHIFLRKEKTNLPLNMVNCHQAEGIQK